MDLFSQFGSKLNDIAQKLEELSVQVPEIKAALALKADSAEVVNLDQEFSALRNLVVRDRSEFVQKQDLEILSVQLQGVCAEGASKTEQIDIRAQTLDDQLRVLQANVAQNVARLEEKWHGLTEGVSQKADSADVSAMGSKLKQFEEALMLKADGSVTVRLEREVLTLNTAMARKPDASVLEQQNEMYRNLNSTLGQKAEHTEMDVLKIKLHALNGTVAQKGEIHAAEVEAMSAQLQDACAGTAKIGSEVTEIRDIVDRLRTDVALKAESERVEGLLQQFQVLGDMLAPKLRQLQSPRPRSARVQRPKEPATRVRPFNTTA